MPDLQLQSSNCSRGYLSSCDTGDAESTLRADVVLVQDAPKTGQHTVEEDLRDEALSHFFAVEQQPTTTPTTGGVNNVVNYVETADGHKYILRIYNNGNKTEKVSSHTLDKFKLS